MTDEPDPPPHTPAPAGAPAPQRNRKRRRARLIVYCVFLLALIGVGVSGRMESFFYYPDRSSFPTPPGVEDVRFPTTDSLTLHAWFIPADPRTLTPGQKPPAILVAHGNAGNISNHVGFAEFLPPAGFSVLIFDYRSYGRSDRSPRSLRRADLAADTNAALNYLLTRDDIDKDRIGLFAISLGGAFGLAVAAERPEIKAVVTMAAFSGWQSVAAAHAWILGPALIRSGLDPIDSAQRLGSRPYLIVHGDRDEVVPVSHASELSRAARAAGVQVETYISPRSTHNGVLWEDEHASDVITRFLRRALGDGAPPSAASSRASR